MSDRSPRNPEKARDKVAADEPRAALGTGTALDQKAP